MSARAPSNTLSRGQPDRSQPPLVLELPEPLLGAIAARAAALVLKQLADLQQPSPYLTIPEAAAYLCCKRQRIDDLLSARKLTRYKDGRRTLVLRSELEALPTKTTGPASRPQPTG